MMWLAVGSLGWALYMLMPVSVADEVAPRAIEASRAVSSLRPEAVLENAVRAQHGEGLRGAVRDIRGKFEVYSYEDGKRIEADTLQAYRIDDEENENYLSIVTDRSQQTTAMKGFDGSSYWIKTGKTGRKLRGREDRIDRDSIDDDMDQVKSNLRYFFLENLQEGDAEFEVVAEHALAPKNTVGLLRKAPGERPVILFFSCDDWLLWRALLPRTEGATADDSLRIDFFPRGKNKRPERCGKVFRGDEKDDKIWIPRDMVLYKGATSKYPSQEFFLNSLKINSGLDRDFFTLETNSNR